MSNINKLVVDQIEHYKRNIGRVKPPESNPAKILHCLNKLSKLPIGLEELKQTSVGRLVNTLSKRDDDIGSFASGLVAKWKTEVAATIDAQQLECESAAEQGASGNGDLDASNNSNVAVENSDDKTESRSERKKKRKSKKSRHRSKSKSKDSTLTMSSASSQNETSQAEGNAKSTGSKVSVDLLALNNIKKEKDWEEDYATSNQLSDTTPQADFRVKVEKSDDGSISTSSKKKKKRKNENNEIRIAENYAGDNFQPISDHDDIIARCIGDDSSSSDENLRGSSNNTKNLDSQTIKKEWENGDSRSKSRKRDFSPHNNLDVAEHKKSKKSSKDKKRKESTEYEGNNFDAVMMELASPAKKDPKASTSKASSVNSLSPAVQSPSDSGSDSIGDPSSTGSTKKEFVNFCSSIAATMVDRSPSTSFTQISPVSKKVQNMMDEESLCSIITNKKTRTKMFSGVKNKVKNFPTLIDLCMRVLYNNFEALDYTGGVPFDILKPLLEQVGAQQLLRFEEFNPYLICETDNLWKFHVQRDFRCAKRAEYESWRELYIRCCEEREEKLKSLKMNINQSMANSQPVRKTKMAFIESDAKPPRNIARLQAKNGSSETSFRPMPVKKKINGPQPSAVAIQAVKEKFAKKEATANTAAAVINSNSPPKVFSILGKKKPAPMMQKVMKQLKGTLYRR